MGGNRHRALSETEQLLALIRISMGEAGTQKLYWHFLAYYCCSSWLQLRSMNHTIKFSHAVLCKQPKEGIK
jgi:hypothetical protein